MLALEIRKGEAVFLEMPDGRTIEVIVSRCSLGRCKLVFDAPKDVKILREKLVNTEKVRIEA